MKEKAVKYITDNPVTITAAQYQQFVKIPEANDYKIMLAGELRKSVKSKTIHERKEAQRRRYVGAQLRATTLRSMGLRRVEIDGKIYWQE